MINPVVWITGAGGLIGNYLVQTAPQFAPGCKVVGLKRAQLDLTDFAAVRRKFLEDPPRLVIHCAALSRSPACEKDPPLARKLNVDVTACLAELSTDIPFIFFSSDLVFDGRKGDYVETDEPAPWCVYSETKIAAEKIVLANPKHTVVRISLNGGTSPTGDRGFNEEMRRAWQAGRELKLFTDEFRCPMPAVVTARAVWELAARNEPGLYHLCGSERLSRWQLGQLIAARWPQLNPRIEASSRKDYTGPPRPADTSLNCAKIQKLLSFPLAGLSEWLKANLNEPF
ncbi:MAG TPA: SDR family oxidoreductase [Verrucomicrobiae bacterium]|nr:SDR family oxidoreductase [Verrucomicrobiae bacterium]